MAAALLGLPVSTTHALTGALTGAGLAMAGAEVNLSRLGGAFFLPLLASPLLALAATAPLYAALRYARLRLGWSKEWCMCVGEREVTAPIAQPEPAMALTGLRAFEAAPAGLPALGASLGPAASCVQRYRGRFLGVKVQAVLNAGHFASAGAIGFARGLNDAPKILGVLLAARLLPGPAALLLVAAAMAAGGWFNARRVAETVSRRITPLSHGQGLSANLVTSSLVLFASRWGLPVSTTHVGVGALLGIGAVTGKADPKVISCIFSAWVLTLPLAALLGAAAALLLSGPAELGPTLN